MSDKSCNLFDTCEAAEAPLCPIQDSTIKCGIWYPDEPICHSSQFQELSWIKKQRQIASYKLKSSEGFFTVRMLDALHSITPEVRGADPDYPNAEDKWFKAWTASAKEKGKEAKVIKKDIVQKSVNIPLFKETDFLPQNTDIENIDVKKGKEHYRTFGKKKNNVITRETGKTRSRKKKIS